MSSKRYPRRTFTECTSRFRSRLTMCRKFHDTTASMSCTEAQAICRASSRKAGGKEPGLQVGRGKAQSVRSLLQDLWAGLSNGLLKPCPKARGRLSDLVQKEDGDIALQPALGISAAEARGSPRLGRGPRSRKGLRKQTYPNITVKPLTLRISFRCRPLILYLISRNLSTQSFLSGDHSSRKMPSRNGVESSFASVV